jgi:hypothetical protein
MMQRLCRAWLVRCPAGTRPAVCFFLVSGTRVKRQTKRPSPGFAAERAPHTSTGKAAVFKRGPRRCTIPPAGQYGTIPLDCHVTLRPHKGSVQRSIGGLPQRGRQQARAAGLCFCFCLLREKSAARLGPLDGAGVLKADGSRCASALRREPGNRKSNNCQHLSRTKVSRRG